MYKVVSVIMPVRNEAGYIYRSLNSVLTQTYPRDYFEVIVTDGCSIDNTANIVQGMMKRHANLKLISNNGRIVSTGLNTALKQARGEIIIRIDGHCEIEADYIQRCVEYLSMDAIDGVGGAIETVGETPTSIVIAAAMSSKFGVGGATFRVIKSESFVKPITVDTVPFPAYKRSIINRAGLFDEELVRNQDDEYNYRLRKIGANIMLAPNIKSKYYSRSSIGKVIKQYFEYGMWKVRVMQKHPRQMKLRQFAPPLFVSSLIIFFIISIFYSTGMYIPGIILGSYVAVNILSSLLTHEVRLIYRLIYLPVVYSSLHISYGAGFIWGLFRFAGKFFSMR